MSIREITPAAPEASGALNNELRVLNWPLVQDGWRSVFYVALTLVVSIGTARVSGHATAGSVAAAAMVIPK